MFMFQHVCEVAFIEMLRSRLKNAAIACCAARCHLSCTVLSLFCCPMGTLTPAYLPPSANGAMSTVDPLCVTVLVGHDIL